MPKLAQPKAEVAFRNAAPRSKPYLISDGKGLGLLVTPDGGKQWVFRYRVDGKERKLHIRGGYPGVSVAKAREEAERLRGMIARGEDPREVRKASQEELVRQAEEVRKEEIRTANTFEKVARDSLARSAEHLDPVYAASKLRQLEKNVFPFIGPVPLADLQPKDIIRPLQEVERRGARETAHRLLSFCGEVFRYGVASGLIGSDPTRDLRGALKRPVEKHFAALTKPEEVAGLLRVIEGYQGDSVTRSALQLGILTFVRPGNLQHAEWAEFHHLDDPDRAEWRIPGAKMKVKTSRPFIVPMSPQAVAVLEGLRPLTGHSHFVFPSVRTPKRPISNNTINAALRRMGYTSDDMTGHGVRAMARTLCHEVLKFAPEVIEEQLAHGKAGPLRDAYDRTTHMPERRRLMRAWADYLDGLSKPALGRGD